jgi:4-hydroxybenzoate polyprenyltransferase
LATAADYDADKAAGHRTLAVHYSRRAAAALAFAAFLVTWLIGDFHGTAVRVYLAICVGATLIALLLPRDRTIAVACITIFIGFLLAGALHVAGW